MRLINADKLKRKAQKVATESWKMKLTAKIDTTLNQFIDWIDEAETIDAVPVTRCKDCKHLFDGEHNANCCDVLMEKAKWVQEITVDDNWYCGDGERRTDDCI